MFARKERIPRNILAAFSGNRYGTREFQVRTANNGLPHCRFAISVSKKVDPRATRRHTLKRRAVPLLKAASLTGKDVFLSILPAASKLSREEFTKEIQSLIKNLETRN